MSSKRNAQEQVLKVGDKVQHVISKRKGQVVGHVGKWVAVLFDGDSYRTECLAARVEIINESVDG